MSLRPYKFIVKAVPQILDEAGDVSGEETNVEPVVLIGVERLVAWAEAFPVKLAEADAARSADQPPQE